MGRSGRLHSSLASGGRGLFVMASRSPARPPACGWDPRPPGAGRSGSSCEAGRRWPGRLGRSSAPSHRHGTPPRGDDACRGSALRRARPPRLSASAANSAARRRCAGSGGRRRVPPMPAIISARLARSAPQGLRDPGHAEPHALPVSHSATSCPARTLRAGREPLDARSGRRRVAITNGGRHRPRSYEPPTGWNGVACRPFAGGAARIHHAAIDAPDALRPLGRPSADGRIAAVRPAGARENGAGRLAPSSPAGSARLVVGGRRRRLPSVPLHQLVAPRVRFLLALRGLLVLLDLCLGGGGLSSRFSFSSRTLRSLRSCPLVQTSFISLTFFRSRLEGLLREAFIAFQTPPTESLPPSMTSTSE